MTGNSKLKTKGTCSSGVSPPHAPEQTIASIPVNILVAVEGQASDHQPAAGLGCYRGPHAPVGGEGSDAPLLTTPFTFLTSPATSHKSKLRFERVRRITSAAYMSEGVKKKERRRKK